MAMTKNEIAEGLKTLGLAKGHSVLAHSSLSSLGWVDGGADSVIDALLETIGASGTLIVPTLTGDETLSADNPPVFDVKNTASWTGRIPETFRQRPEAIRSLHPTHSVAAIGAEARSLLDGHFYSITPCDEQSPYGKLAQRDNGYILLIGVTHESSTLFHHVEEVAGLDYHMQPGLAKVKIINQMGETLTRHTMLHLYGPARNFNAAEPILEELGIQHKAVIGQAEVRLVKAMDMVQTLLRIVRVDKNFLLASQG